MNFQHSTTPPLQSVEDEDSGSTELADLSAIASAKEEVLPRRRSASAGPAAGQALPEAGGRPNSFTDSPANWGRSR